ncbi:MAG: DUF4239 domain-containing protein [candidate division KSB1 bacterium]|nr:DUF4239 domain-containing protein [candidate division KSB1 bacterium]MDZ7334960.1 DUF4239 domain-containing protein [candidate division KSB1 bacterium]MDZ7358432.1 DUF4239 domain-containing protein [candidate division KSB1 bacterium]MDZ7401733.1 DUF4239 domain-containing protein [candidate division KSB1 bacterium]
MKYFRKRYLVSAAAMILAICLFVLLFLLARHEDIFKADAPIIGNFIEWFGVLYGVLLALVVVEVWQKNSVLNNEIDREADALVLMLKTARFLNDREGVRDLAIKTQQYAEMILAHKTTDAFESQQAADRLDEIHRAIGKLIKTADPCPLPFANQLIYHINDAFDTRGDWIARAKVRMPTALQFLVFFASLVWVLGFFGLNITSDILAGILCGSATLTVSTILFIIVDLDDPKSGVWKAEFDSFKVLKKTAEEIISGNF